MLYERWQHIAQTHARKIALTEGVNGRAWTFAELAAAVEQSDAPAHALFPQGHTAEFILEVLSGWRARVPVCPLELGQTAPDLSKLPSGIAHVKLTSATTGPARLVLFTADQLAADAENIIATMGLTPDVPNLGVISLAHSYGFSNLITPLLLHGVPLVLVSSPLPENVRHAVAAHPAVVLPAVPALWRAWQEAGILSSRIRLAISAGAPLPLALEQSVFQAAQLKLHNFYGSSECGGIAYDATSEPRTEASVVGTPLHHVRLAVNAHGCLEVRSRAVAQTYWPEPEAALGAGCFVTSDLAQITDSTVRLSGRASDLINIAGRKLSPELIERALLQHPAVRECLVFGVPEAESARGESIVACVAGHTALEAETLKQFLLRTLPAWQVPREWILRETLPTNARGKLSRAEWRQRYLNGAR